MVEIQESVLPEPGPRFRCSLCKKTFEQESSAKRHYYYCRSKPADTKESRKRSCAACVRAKTRCIWPADNSTDACARCNKRNITCEYDTVIMRHKMMNKSSRDTVSVATSVIPIQEGPIANVQESSTTVVSVRGASQNETTSLDQNNENYLYLGETAELPFLDGIDVALEELGVGVEPVPYEGISAMPLACTNAAHLSTTRPPTPLTYQPSNTPLFTTRPFTRPDHVALVSLAMRVLGSYPSMMTTKGSLPPFINPSSYSWAHSGGDHKLHKYLVKCPSLIQSFNSGVKTNKSSWAWGRIWHEQERILAQYMNFDRWELLDAMQTLLIFCLLRIQDVPVGHAVFDISLLTTANLVSQALGLFVGQCFDFPISEDPAVAWKDWIFLESRRRTVLIFQILGLLVDISAAVSYFSSSGFVLVPLPSSAAIWTTQDLEQWKREYRKWQKNVIYGLSESGDLARLQSTNNGILSTPAEWEGWSAEVGDPATLIMMIGELLKNQ
ncbi:hypothetical protein F4679DRAFT_124205 [Xylaria curta]|nr:hypothetical protein F4679DRAFT_124205 [Xylaria curta]